jgi:Predicted membrane protein (DUF2231)
MFDTIAGLPVHALVVHGVVVLMPLMVLVTVVTAFRPGWPDRVAWWVVAADTVLLGLTFVARQSGLALEARVGTTPPVLRHSQWGSTLPWTALGLLAAAVVLAVLRSRGTAALRVGQVVTVAAAVVAGWWVFRTGDSGARAVWEAVVRNTSPP